MQSTGMKWRDLGSSRPVSMPAVVSGLAIMPRSLVLPQCRSDLANLLLQSPHLIAETLRGWTCKM